MPITVNQPAQAYRYQDDEISLIDIWLILARRKKLIAGITAFALVVGALLALLLSPIFEYRASIEIGSRLVTDKSFAIEQPENTLAKLQQSYIPAVLMAHHRATQVSDVEIVAQIPKNSEIIVLTTKGTAAREEELVLLQNQIIESLQHDHQRIISTLKADLDIKRRSLENQLASLKDQATMLEADKIRLKERRELLKDQIADLKRLVESTEAQYKRAVAKPGNEANAMTLLLLDSEARETRTKLSDLQERLQIVLSSDEDKLANQVADNQRKQSEVTDQIAKVDMEMANFRETRAVVPPMQSLEPVGLGKMAMVLLALIAGLFGAVFSAFIAEFLSRAKEQLEAADEAQDIVHQTKAESSQIRVAG